MAEAAGPEPEERTLATFLREHDAMPPDVAARLIALDAGRHPSLTDMRRALGLDLDLSAVWEAHERARPDYGASPPDAALASMLDGMYRSVRATRMVRAEITETGPRVGGPAAPVVLREDEHLVLLAFADNTSGAQAEFSAEAHGEGVGGYIEPGRTGSALLDAGAMPRGSYLLPVMVVANGRPATVDLAVECLPAGTLTVRIVDDGTGAPVPARVYLSDDAGPGWPAGATVRRDRHGNAWFHTAGSFTARAAGRTRLLVTRGIEYEPAEMELTVAGEETVERTVRLRRWSHMAADGWRSGDVHVHLHYGGEYALTPADAALAQRAEDVHFLNMMVANAGSGHVLDRGLFAGAPHELSDGDYLLRWGEEHRNNMYGHLCLYGIDALVPPVYCGFEHSEHPYDVPSNADVARRAGEAGGAASYAHPAFGALDLDRVFAEARTVEAKELPVDAALGLVHSVDVMSYPASNMRSAELWYRLLNCGLRLAATAGTDTFMNVCDGADLLAYSRAFSSPPAGARVFVRTDGAFTTESWCAGVRAGRTFVTNGPMLRLAVDSHEIGAELHAAPGATLRVEAEAGSYVPMDRIELIVDGAVVASAEATDGGRRAALAHELRVERSCWVALRATGPGHPLVLDEAAFAHTSPVYVTVDGARAWHDDDAAYFVAWTDRLAAMVEREGRFESDAQRDGIIAQFRAAQAYYRGAVG